MSLKMMLKSTHPFSISKKTLNRFFDKLNLDSFVLISFVNSWLTNNLRLKFAQAYLVFSEPALYVKFGYI